MEISIVIGIRNREKDIKKCIKTLLNQDFNKSYEIVIVDYGGEDNAKKVLESFKDERIRYIYVDEKEGWDESRAKNIGIRNSKGKIIIVTGIDITFERNVLKNTFNRLNKNKNIFLHIIKRNIFSGGRILIHKEGFALGDFQATQRENWFKVQGFDEKMGGHGWMDYDLLMRMKKIGVYPEWMKRGIFHRYHGLHGTNWSQGDLNRIRTKLRISYKVNDENWGLAGEQKERNIFSKIINKVILTFLHILLFNIRKIKLKPEDNRTNPKKFNEESYFEKPIEIRGKV